MKTIRRITLLSLLSTLIILGSSCSVFGPKYGCPGNGKAVGAERILSGDKVPKAPKFKS